MLVLLLLVLVALWIASSLRAQTAVGVEQQTVQAQYTALVQPSPTPTPTPQS